jgi:hypothetical protein
MRMIGGIFTHMAFNNQSISSVLIDVLGGDIVIKHHIGADEVSEGEQQLRVPAWNRDTQEFA